MKIAGTALAEEACSIPRYIRAAKTPIQAWKAANKAGLDFLIAAFDRALHQQLVRKLGSGCCLYACAESADAIRAAIPRARRDKIIKAALRKVPPRKVTK